MAESRTRRYALYAIGELLLVVAGILIALQINNWNEERIAAEEIRGYALDLAAAIDRDMQMLMPVEIQIRTSIRQSQEMAAYLRQRPLASINNADLFFLSTHIGYRPYAWNRAALEQLKTAGGLRLLQNKVLAQRISDYDALTLHLDQDYREDEALAQVMLEQLLQVVDINYDLGDAADELGWQDGVSLSYIDARLTRYQETDLYRRLAGEQRAPLSSDLADFRRLANINLEYADKVWPRPNVELPRLREFGKEIKTLIDAEYR